jgi:hypothetical protein
MIASFFNQKYLSNDKVFKKTTLHRFTCLFQNVTVNYFRTFSNYTNTKLFHLS